MEETIRQRDLEWKSELEERDHMWRDELRERDAAYWEEPRKQEGDLVRMLETRDKQIKDSFVSKY